MLEYPLWMQDEKIVSRINDEMGFVWKDYDGYVYRCGYKPPTKLDAVFLFYLLYRSQKTGWQEEIELSRYEILKDCGFKSIRPADYRRLEDSLERWKMVGVKYNGTFYDGHQYITLSFGIIDTWKIDKNTRKLYVRFNKEWLMRIKNSTYFRYLNFDKIRSLRSPLAMRLYEILIKSFQNRNEWKIDAIKLAQKIPMKERYPADIIPKIKAALNRINKHTNLNVQLLVERKRRGKANLIFLKKNKMMENDSLENVLKLLPKNEAKKKTIIQMIEKYLECYGQDYVKRNIMYANERVRNIKSYRSFLAKALKEDWALGWWEDQLLEEVSLFDTTNIKNDKHDKNERDVRIKVEKILNSLSIEELDRLKLEAIKELPEEMKEDISAIRMQMRFILRRKLLKESDLPSI